MAAEQAAIALAVLGVVVAVAALVAMLAGALADRDEVGSGVAGCFLGGLVTAMDGVLVHSLIREDGWSWWAAWGLVYGAELALLGFGLVMFRHYREIEPVDSGDGETILGGHGDAGNG